MPDCLESLRNQDFSRPFEVIVVDSSTDSTDQMVTGRFPEVRLIHYPSRKFPGDARNAGIAAARGSIICFLDADCVASPNWLTEAWKAHSSPEPVIGGAIANAADKSLAGWASYFTGFSQWMPGTGRGRLPNIPSCNLTFKRWALEMLGPMDEGTYSEDTAYNYRLRRMGHRDLLFEPAIAVAHNGIRGFTGFLAHDLARGRHYGRVRAALEGFTSCRRLAYAAAAPLIWLVLCLRLTARVLRNGRYIAQFAVAAPLAFLGLLAWSVGEGAGYMDGPKVLMAVVTGSRFDGEAPRG